MRRSIAQGATEQRVQGAGRSTKDGAEMMLGEVQARRFSLTKEPTMQAEEEEGRPRIGPASKRNTD